MKRITSYLYFLFCKFFFRFYCPLKVDGREHIPSGSFILCSNHNSHMDTPALMLATGMSFNQFGMIAAKDYFFDHRWRKIFSTIAMNLIPIDRKISPHSLAKNILACKQFVKKGKKNLIMYPEGTRSSTGEIQPFKRGAAMIALELAMPLIPVYIEGTHEAMRKGNRFPKPGKINVKIGKPISVDENKDKGELTTLLENTIKQLKE